jgi:hypothetical protein
MTSLVKRLGTAALAGAAVLALATPALAQPVFRPTIPPQASQIRLNPYLANEALNRAFAISTIGRAYQQVPPYALGYNPYPPVVGSPYVPPVNPYVGNPLVANPYLSGYNSAATYNPYNPYAGGATLTSTGTLPAVDPYSGGGYGGYNPYGSYYENPLGSYFRGLADLTSAQGKYYQDVNKARLMNLEVESAKLDLRRKLFDEWRYERMNTPTTEQILAVDRERQFVRALRQPPLTEILSAKSLNDILNKAKDIQASGKRGPDVPLDADSLKQLNVRSPHGGNMGVIKDAGKLQWPPTLRDDLFGKERKDLEAAFKEAVDRAKFNGNVDREVLKQLRASRKAMEDNLERNISNYSTSQYIEARRYLNFLGDAILALEDPNVAKYFNKTYEAQGKTVADFVDYMRKNGLEIAPAVPGDEAAYRAVHSALAAYADALNQQAASR